MKKTESDNHNERNCCRVSHDEVIPHHYGTTSTYAPEGTAESSISEADASIGEDAPASESGCLGQTWMDGEQLGSVASLTRVRRAATVFMGYLRVVSADRAGDCAGQSLGKQKRWVNWWWS